MYSCCCVGGSKPRVFNTIQIKEVILRAIGRNALRLLIPKAGISNESKYIVNNQINDTRNRNIKQRKPIVNSQISDILQVQCNNYM